MSLCLQQGRGPNAPDRLCREVTLRDGRAAPLALMPGGVAYDV